MADNVTFPLTGTGDATAVCATDDVSGAQVQLMGLIPGPANTALTERIGGDAANGLDVDPTRNVPDTSTSGAITGSGQTVTLALAGKKSASIIITGTFTASLGITASYDGGITYSGFSCFVPSTNGFTNSLSAPAIVNAAGLAGVTHLRVNVTSFTSGTANVSIIAVESGVLELINKAVSISGLTPPAALVMCGSYYDLSGTAVPNIADVIPPNGSLGMVVRDTASKVDDAAFTPATSEVLMAGYECDDTSPDSVNEGDAGAARMSANRNIYMNIRDGAGGERGAGVVDETGSSAVDALAIGGGTPHDSVNSGNPLYLGAEAIAHGTNPTAVAAADRTKLYANRAGIPFVIGGHPNIVTIKHTTITTAVTDAAIVTVSSGLKIVVTRITVTLDNASTVFPTLLIGFGATNTPTTTGVLVAHGGVPAGGGVNVGDGSGILGIGADGEDLRVTTTGNATGNGLQIVVSYHTIES